MAENRSSRPFPVSFEMGLYFNQVKEYYNFFPKNQIKIVVYEDWIKDINSEINSLYIFLNVDTLESILEITADTIYTYRNDTCGGTTQFVFPNNMTGYGRINLNKALKMIRPELNTSYSTLVSSSISVYPVPIIDKVAVKSESEYLIFSIKLFTILGEEMVSIQNINHSLYELDFVKYSNGIYFLSIETEGGHLIKKIVKP